MQNSNTTKIELTIGEYENVVLLTDFISKIKSELQNKNYITDIKFTPREKGYTISFIDNGISSLISISFKFDLLHKLKITYRKGTNKIKTYKSKYNDDNTTIVNNIFK